jgi:hypothetical protein
MRSERTKRFPLGGHDKEFISDIRDLIKSRKSCHIFVVEDGKVTLRYAMDGGVGDLFGIIFKVRYKDAIDALEAVFKRYENPDAETLRHCARVLWDQFSDIPMNPETECIEERWMDFPVGTPREDVWIWFEAMFNVSVHDLMYGGEEDD